MNFIDKHAIWLNDVGRNRIDSNDNARFNLHGDTNLVKTNKQTFIECLSTLRLQRKKNKIFLEGPYQKISKFYDKYNQWLLL